MFPEPELSAGTVKPGVKRTSAERTRRYRQRLRRGTLSLNGVRIEPNEVAHLESLGYIDGTQRHNLKALVTAVEAYLSDQAWGKR